MENKNIDYKLLLPNTEFPMRGNLGVNEPNIQKRWEEINLYQKIIEKNTGKKPFYLHDGPPYANGQIHLGHALNKVLKDFLIRYKSMNGYYAPYLPGWDTHGLPIEVALSKNSKVNRKELSVAAFRKLCEEYALNQIELQKAGFKRLGVLGEWDEPYITLKPKYEAIQIRAFGKMVERGLIFKGLKPVYWSPSSETALAEAEVEYYDVDATSIFVAFPSVDTKGLLPENTEFIIWTTTPWTIPANLAICAGPLFDYVCVRVETRTFVVAEGLLESVSKTLGWENVEVLKKLRGEELEGMTYIHKLYGRVSPIILGSHVTLDSGTGLVHTAPGHGEDDFIVGKRYNLDVLCPVDEKGFMTKEAGRFEGMFYEDANKAVIEALKEENMLLKETHFMHSYPHDWRTKKPIIFRATPQWFASIDSLKEDILKEIKNVEWVPSWGEVRLSNMIKDREDWCISRQRVWGVPIPVFYAENKEPILSPELIEHVAKLFEQYGSNIWFEKEAKDLLPAGFTHPGSPNGKFTKETDIMDVWFDSGTSHHAALGARYGVTQADVYLEGSDQYRGWFNSSLITGVALTGKAPYKSVISHGFTLDGQGRKQSKSLGNTIDPNKVCQEMGADILRLWVSSVSYQADMALSKEILAQISEAYKKIRNTLRFLLGNISDFDPDKDFVPYEKLGEVDKYILIKLNDFVASAHHGYETYAFDEVYRETIKLMTITLSSFYLDYTKDVLYVAAENDPERRAIQTVFYEILNKVTTVLCPILPHTMDEVYSFMPKRAHESVYLEDMAMPSNIEGADALKEKMASFLSFRDDILKALEIARNDRVIGKSLNAKVEIKPTQKVKELLASLEFNVSLVLIVSGFEVVDELNEGMESESGLIKVSPAEGKTCERCKKMRLDVDDDCLCGSCRKVLGIK